MVIDHGRVISDGTVTEIKSTYGQVRTLVVDFEEIQPPVRLDGVSAVRVDGVRQWLEFSRSTSAARLVAQVLEIAAVRDVSIEEPHIDDVVRRVYGASGAADSAEPSR